MTGHSPILVADIGGTNARFALADVRAGVVSLIARKATEADDYPNVGEAARAFLSASGASPTRAVFAVAAPVTGDEITFTNSPWRFSQQALARELGCTLTVVNDFVAMARGAVEAQGADIVVIKAGVSVANAPVAVLGPGTGLGLGIVVKSGGCVSVLATQGGFSAFAPQDQQEIAVLQHVQRENQAYVAFEHVLSGRGLTALYDALSKGSAADAPPPEEVSAAALHGRDPVARAATELFCAILGTFAGNAALMAGARGGVILAGGIVPKIETILRASRFVERFSSRDAMSDYMRDIPVSLLRSSDAALIGAALLAIKQER